MPKLLFARAPLDEKEEYQIRKLAGSRHAPADWITRADRPRHQSAQSTRETLDLGTPTAAAA